MKNTVFLDGRQLTLADVVAVCYDNAQATLAPDAKERMAESRNFVEERVAANQLIFWPCGS